MKDIIERAIQLQATDIHLEEGKHPYFRFASSLVGDEKLNIVNIGHFYNLVEKNLKNNEVEKEEVVNQYSMIKSEISMMTFDKNTDYLEARNWLWRHIEGEGQDFTILYGSYRYRVHMYKANNRICAALRYLKEGDWLLESDNQADLWIRLCNKKEGLLLITGQTGAGKSYMLASCLDYINRHRQVHIVTIEDPVEYTLSNHKSIVHQREVGRDLLCVEEGLREILREDPDIIMIGEMRDYGTMEAALHAAETGHLVFATMHTSNARQAVGRIISAFPGNRQEEVRNILSHVLGAVIYQRLIRLEDMFIPIRDILINTPAVANLIRQGKEHQLKSMQETSKDMITFDTSLKEAIMRYGRKEDLLRAGDIFYV